MEEKCEICEKADQYSWRIEDLEKKVAKLNNLLFGTLISSISTLVGVIVILLTK